MSSVAILIFVPLTVFYFQLVCTHYDCALSSPVYQLASGDISIGQIWNQIPPVSMKAFQIVLGWFIFQVILYNIPDLLHHILPGYAGGVRTGPITPGGVQLQYRLNALQAFILSNGIFLANAFYFKWFSPTVVLENWGELLWAANALGFASAAFVYIKAFLFPSNKTDWKSSGNIATDFVHGVELNPRMGKWFDFKHFFNGRPGHLTWTLINMSFAFHQYQQYGYVTNSLILINVLQGVYAVDFCLFEGWYLNTIDIQDEKFGWMFAWGDCVFLPWMYTLQGFYLCYHPTDLSTPMVILILSLGLSGYYIFRTANNQKDLFRRTHGNCLINGKRPQFLTARYRTNDGTEHKSKLLISGFWGMARHMNYTGDLMGALSYSLACASTYAVPNLYIFFLFFGMLMPRCLQDEIRCKKKYGKDWDKYTSKVPYRLIPGVF